MSTTARKARKRQRHTDLALREALAARGLPTDSVYVHPPFQHPVKVGTPRAQRAVEVRRAEREVERALGRPGVYTRVLAAMGRIGARFGGR
jgi:hypothetical protein